MLSRRDLIATGAFLSQARGTPPLEAAQSNQRGPRSSDELQALVEIRDTLRDLRHLSVSGTVNQVRERQRTFFRQYQRFPEFIDIGLRVWELLLDWHVENQRELNLTRSPEGRYHMEFMMTQLVLRYELTDTEVGIAYDR